MVYVYCISNQDGSVLYVGSTNDLERRFNEHQEGKVNSTKNKGKLILEFYIAFRQNKTARNFEKYLKSGSGKAFMCKRFLTNEASA